MNPNNSINDPTNPCADWKVNPDYQSALFEEDWLGHNGKRLHSPFPRRFLKAEDWPKNPVPMFIRCDGKH